MNVFHSLIQNLPKTEHVCFFEGTFYTLEDISKQIPAFIEPSG